MDVDIEAGVGTGTDREALWLPLLRRLTDEQPEWAVWKNADSALHGQGDVDAVATRRAWAGIERAVVDWAGAAGIGPVVVCRHIPRTLNLLTVPRDGGGLLQLELKAGATFRGSVQFSAEHVLALSVLDARGFRRLRDGAEGLLKLLNNGTRRGGRRDDEGLRRKHVVQLLRADPEGAAAMAATFGPARGALLRAVDAVLRDDWDRGALLLVEGWSLLRAVGQPHVVAERAWFRAVRKPHDPVLAAVYREDRRIPGDVATWLSAVARTHPVLG